MADVLEAILDGRQLPPSPLIVLTDSPVFPCLGLVRECLRRSVKRRCHTVLITVLHPPQTLFSSSVSTSENVKVIDWTHRIPGYSVERLSHEEAIQREVLEACQALEPGSQVFIDAVDLIAEDCSSRFALKLIRSILNTLQVSKNSRLILSLPHASPFLPSLLAPSLSPALTLLHPLSPSLVTHLSRAYLARVEPSPAFWQILENAKRRRVPEDLAWRAVEGNEVNGRWDELPSSASASSSSRAGASGSAGSRGGAVVQILVRKATGGMKGMTRALAGLAPSPRSGPAGVGMPREGDGLHVVETGELVRVDPLNDPTFVRPPSKPGFGPTAGPASGGGGAHSGLDLPFNLSLTDEQKRRRGEVALPYVHEGEGGAEVDADVGMDWEDEDEDDEEI